MNTHPPTIRPARAEDIDGAAELLVRLKRLNSEFDPLFTVPQDSLERAKKYLEESLRGESRGVVLVADVGGKVVGLLKADLRERRFYDPRLEGALIEFYILPEYRRGGLGEKMIREAVKRLREMGAQIVTAEFPTNNLIAVNFYKKLGFRPLMGVYATEKSEKAP